MPALIPLCPFCPATNVTAGHILGHGGKGVKKTISKKEHNRRSAHALAMTATRMANRNGGVAAPAPEPVKAVAPPVPKVKKQRLRVKPSLRAQLRKGRA